VKRELHGWKSRRRAGMNGALASAVRRPASWAEWSTASRLANAAVEPLAQPSVDRIHRGSLEVANVAPQRPTTNDPERRADREAAPKSGMCESSSRRSRRALASRARLPIHGGPDERPRVQPLDPRLRVPRGQEPTSASGPARRSSGRSGSRLLRRDKSPAATSSEACRLEHYNAGAGRMSRQGTFACEVRAATASSRRMGATCSSSMRTGNRLPPLGQADPYNPKVKCSWAAGRPKDVTAMVVRTTRRRRSW